MCSLLGYHLKWVSKGSHITGFDLCTLLVGKVGRGGDDKQQKWQNKQGKSVFLWCVELKLTMLSCISPRHCFFCRGRNNRATLMKCKQT